MSTLAADARQRAAKTALVYLVIAILCAAFGAVYELYSHEVYSYFMLYAFAFPLCGGALPYLIYSQFSGIAIPNSYDRLLGHAGIATLTIGSIISGVLEIYGTTNLLTSAYWVAGGALFLGFIFGIFSYFIPDDADHQDNAIQENDLLPPCSFAEEWSLKAQLVDVDADHAICYELTCMDENGNKALLPENTTLTLPYPKEMTCEEAKDCEFIVFNERSTGMQIFSTQNGTLKRTMHGLELFLPAFSSIRDRINDNVF